MKKILLLLAVMFAVFGCKDMPTSDVNKIAAYFDRDTTDKDAVAQIDEDEIVPDLSTEAEVEADEDLVEAEPLDEDVADDLVDTAEAMPDDDAVVIPDVDMNECTNDDTQTLTDVCGFNGNGDQSQVCIGGQWTNDGACVDPDLCGNGMWQAIMGNASECVLGQWTLRRMSMQWGTSASDAGYSVAVDTNDNIFVAGWTYGDLDDNTRMGGNDIFLTKWNVNGSKAWTKQWGTENPDGGASVAVDSSGNVYVVGYTDGNL